MVCYGCKPENKCAYKELRACVTAKMYNKCGLCDEYPCILIKDAFDKSDKLKDLVKELCTQKEMDNLQKAFFSKTGYFDRICQSNQKKL